MLSFRDAVGEGKAECHGFSSLVEGVVVGSGWTENILERVEEEEEGGKKNVCRSTSSREFEMILNLGEKETKRKGRAA